MDDKMVLVEDSWALIIYIFYQFKSSKIYCKIFFGNVRVKGQATQIYAYIGPRTQSKDSK